jgi:hypothetical protein
MKPQYIYIDAYGNKFFFKDKKMTKIHREDGPAIEYADGSLEWRINGQIHREDGPAVVYANGDEGFFLNNWYYTKAAWTKKVAKVVELTLEDIALLAGVDVEKIKIVKKKS